MARTQSTFESELAVSPAAAWSWATSAAGIDAEMAPLIKMTLPAGVMRVIPQQPSKEPAFRSTLLLFGLLPIGRSDLTIVELAEGRRFLHRSPMRSIRFWQHERSVQPTVGGCRLTDRLSFEPRFDGFVVAFFVNVFFRHRHAVSRRRLGPKQG